MMRAGSGARSLESKTVLRIRWRSSSKHLTTGELAEPEATSGAMTSAKAGIGAHVAAETSVQ